MKIHANKNQNGNGLVVTVSVVMTILAILGAAVSYTGHLSRISQRTRRTALAMEIADGHLEYLFTNWRNIYRKTWTTTSTGGTDDVVLATNYFFTSNYNPGPAPTAVPNMSPSATPPTISLPAKSNFPTEPNYTVTQYRIQAVDPMITLDASENALVETSWGSGSYTSLSPSASPPAAYGPNMLQTTGKKKTGTSNGQHSYFYLAAVDVNVPAIGTGGGTVTAKVRRVFEKKFDVPWTYAMLFMDDLEFQPSTSLTINGPIQTNGGLYIGTSNFTATDRVGYGGDYVNGYSPNDTSSHSGGISAPNFPANEPPSQVSPFLPFGWNLAAGENYHDLIQRPPSSGTDPIAGIRYYNQPGYEVVINADTSVTITKIDSNGSVSNVQGNPYNTLVGNNGQGSNTTILQQNQALYDAREGGAVKVTNVDISQLVSNLNNLNGWTGVLYLADAGARTYNADGTIKNNGTSANVTINGVTSSTTRRAFRLINGYALPSSGLTIVSENPVYVQGNYNTSSTSSATVPSNNGTYTSPTASGYTRVPAAIVADAVNILSGGWTDSNSASSISSRVATANTTVNAALVAGNVPSGGGSYSGGGENFIRFLEDWGSKTFCYYGSMVELYRSNQAIGAWGKANVYNAPGTNRWFYDDATFSSANPPGNLQIAAYLQQQRWYQVY